MSILGCAVKHSAQKGQCGLVIIIQPIAFRPLIDAIAVNVPRYHDGKRRQPFGRVGNEQKRHIAIAKQNPAVTRSHTVRPEKGSVLDNVILSQFLGPAYGCDTADV